MNFDFQSFQNHLISFKIIVTLLLVFYILKENIL